MEQYEKINSELEEQLLFITHETNCCIKQAELSVPICANALDAIKKRVYKLPFKSPKDEIFFFKYLKPKISSRLIYHVQVFNIETRKPSGTNQQQKKYLSRQLKNINRFVEENLEFHQYYRSNSVFLDEKYFIRGKADLHLILNNGFYNYDPNFNTSHDHMVALIIANDRLTIYIRDEINKLERQNKLTDQQQHNNPKFTWTDSKTYLVELIYALHAIGAIENGKPDIKEIATTFQRVFNIDLGNYYHAYIEIRNRKSGRTKFLTLLQEALTKKMDEQDGK
ncbi:MAG: RteC domain-containing protein [Bacteroidia bacterium]|nr:RteC domain-containing protein [Bacteroidia bacterium]